MHITLTIEERAQGLWRVCRGDSVLHDELGFAAAIRLARGLARKQHAGSGQPAGADLVCADFNFTLAHYDNFGFTNSATRKAD